MNIVSGISAFQGNRFDLLSVTPITKIQQFLKFRDLARLAQTDSRLFHLSLLNPRARTCSDGTPLINPEISRRYRAESRHDRLSGTAHVLIAQIATMLSFSDLGAFLATSATICTVCRKQDQVIWGPHTRALELSAKEIDASGSHRAAFRMAELAALHALVPCRDLDIDLKLSYDLQAKQIRAFFNRYYFVPPSVIDRTPHERAVDLRNKTVTFPLSIRGNRINYISYSNTGNKSIPVGLSNLPRLSVLLFCNSPETVASQAIDISNIARLNKLMSITFSNVTIKDSKTAGQFLRLRTLLVVKTGITQMPLAFKICPALRKLDISLNSLKKWPDLSGYPQLTSLDLANTSLSQLPGPEILQMKHLRVLRLNNNQISGDLTPQVLQLPALETLDLSRNQFKCILPETFLELDRIAATRRTKDVAYIGYTLQKLIFFIFNIQFNPLERETVDRLNHYPPNKITIFRNL